MVFSDDFIVLPLWVGAALAGWYATDFVVNLSRGAQSTDGGLRDYTPPPTWASGQTTAGVEESEIIQTSTEQVGQTSSPTTGPTLPTSYSGAAPDRGGGDLEDWAQSMADTGSSSSSSSSVPQQGGGYVPHNTYW